MCGGAGVVTDSSGSPRVAAKRRLRAAWSTDSVDSLPESVHTPVAHRGGLCGDEPSPATPPKRRRLITVRLAPACGPDTDQLRKAPLGGSAAEGAQGARGPPEAEAAATESEGAESDAGAGSGGPLDAEHEPEPAPEVLCQAAPETPSRGDGIPDGAERAARLLASARARELVRRVLAAGAAGTGEVELTAQLLACRGVQAFHAAVSMRDASHEVLPFGAALAALQAAGAPCGAEDVLRAGGVRAEEATRPLCTWIYEVAAALRTAPGEAVGGAPEQPLELAARFAERLAERLPDSGDFRDACAADPAAAARQLAPRLKRVAACFVVDAHQGPDALRLPPRTLAAAAAALATGYVLRWGGIEVGAGECFQFLRGEHESTDLLAPGRLREAVGAIVGVSRLWLEESRRPCFDGCRATSVDP